MRFKEVIKGLEKNYGNTALAEIQIEGPFQVLISTVLSQRTKDEVTYPVSRQLFDKYPNAEKLSRAKLADIGKIIRLTNYYKTKARRIKEIARIINTRYHNKVPEDLETLISLPGVGRKTANCVIVYGHKKIAIPVDTHVHRISNRLGWVKTKRPEETERELMKKLPKQYWLLVNDLLVNHGRTVCRPISPFCSKCSISRYCMKVGVKTSR
jgi:endonuclease-3